MTPCPSGHHRLTKEKAGNGLKLPENCKERKTIFKKIVSLFVVTRIVQAFSGLFFFLTVDDCLTQKSPTV